MNASNDSQPPFNSFVKKRMVLSDVAQSGEEYRIVSTAPAVGNTQTNVFSVPMDTSTSSQPPFNPFDKKRKAELDYLNKNETLMITNGEDSNTKGELVLFCAGSNASTGNSQETQPIKVARRKSKFKVKNHSANKR